MEFFTKNYFKLWYAPEIRYRQNGAFKRDDTNLSFSVSSIFSTERLQDYFYEVAPEFSTDTRSFFDAQGGYMVTDLGYRAEFDIIKNLHGFAGGKLASIKTQKMKIALSFAMM